MFTADALLLAPDYTEVELIYSRDEYREAWAALWREREVPGREAFIGNHSDKPATGFVGQQKLAAALDVTYPGIFARRVTNILRYDGQPVGIRKCFLKMKHMRRCDVMSTR